MNTPNPAQPSQWQRTTTRRFLKCLFSWRTARRLLVAIAVIVTLIFAYYAEENLRGAHAWSRYREEAKARGESLDLRVFIPKPVPDDQNFAATPFVTSWFVRTNHTFAFNPSEYWGEDEYGRVMDAVSGSRDTKDAGNRHFTDLVAWHMAFDALQASESSPTHHSAQDGKLRNQKFETSQLDRDSRAQAAPSILEGLKTNAAVFTELRAASRRPYSRYPINYDVPDPAEILLPHLNSLRAICRRLQLKACAELSLGQSEEAFEDLKLSFSVADSLKDEPFLISYLVRAACLQIAIQPIWEGLAEHTWSDAQLRQLQAHLQRYDFVADLKPTFGAERSWGIGIIDFVRRSGKYAELSDTGNDGGSSLNRIVKMVPNGWFDLELVSYCRLFGLELAGTFDPASKRVFPSRSKSNEQALDRAFTSRSSFETIFVRHRVLSRMLLPALGAVVRKGASAQVATDQAILACALERYRMANGQFPETLDALVPQVVSQLPHDVITGEPYKYRLRKDGQFVLYSVGWNEKDDDGVPGKTLFDDKEGDWVWQYPPLQ
ncbi:MAG TPA: hypothetical protein VMP11_19695 [Verrucomicrobiae bacterium]|nr:hypothetical protein [Verrucomicrobiae bacterium]